ASAEIVEEEIMPGFDDDVPIAMAIAAEDAFPSINWEEAMLAKASHPGLPMMLDSFTENNTDYLVLEWPLGNSLWAACDEPEADAGVRYGWLQKIAAILQALHSAGVVYEGIRPDVIVIGADGQPRITDLADALPFPLPPDAPIRATLYTAPELITSP